MIAYLLALAIATPSQESQRNLRADEVITLERASSQTLHRTTDFEGMLYVWARGADVDPFLRIESTAQAKDA